MQENGEGDLGEGATDVQPVAEAKRSEAEFLPSDKQTQEGNGLC